MNIREFFQNYKENTDYNKEMVSKTRNLSNREEWFDIITDTSITQSQLYLENKNAIKEFFDYLDAHGEGGHFTKEEADEIRDNVLDLYYNDYDDYVVLVRAINPLIEYYKRERDYSSLVKLHACKNYEIVEFLSRFHDKDIDADYVLEDAISAINYKAFYPKLDSEARAKIFSSYYNVVNVNLNRAEHNIDLTYYYLIEADNFYNSPVVSDEDRNNPRVLATYSRIHEEWLSFFDKIEEGAKETKEYYMNLSDKFFNEGLAKEGSIAKLRYDVVLSHYETEYLRGNITVEEGLIKIIEYYIERKKIWEKQDLKPSARKIDTSFDYLDYLYFFINIPVSVIAWIEIHKIDISVYEKYIKIFLQDIHDKWDELYLNLSGAFLDTYIMDICLAFLPFCGGRDEQEAWLKKLLLKRHLPTFVHSSMVSSLAEAIAMSIIKEKPSLLSCEKFSEEYIKGHKGEILEFIKNAALFHDLGKARIGEIISLQTRPISDEEFNVIKNHPMFGAKYVDKAPFLEAFRDVILGHHKFYDGKGGYPAEYDNTKSVIRPFVDLITICDCLDAATDFLSRNYNTAKSLETVLEEIRKGSGTRYNPNLAEFLIKEEKLKEKLSYITGDGRILKYYAIYEEYFAHE